MYTIVRDAVRASAADGRSSDVAAVAGTTAAVCFGVVQKDTDGLRHEDAVSMSSRLSSCVWICQGFQVLHVRISITHEQQ